MYLTPRVALLGLFAAGGEAVIRGANLGGWLSLEPWITPTIFNSTTPESPDEWHLCAALGKSKCLDTLKQHWSTFYTRDDFVQIKNAGLNAVRIPIPYWAVDLQSEPYVQGQYPYLIQAVNWAGEVGLTVLLDLHSVPGSQNGWEQSGLVGPIAFPANQSNTDRALNVLKNLTTEFTKSQYKGVVNSIELMNEPIFETDLIKAFYTEATKIVGAASPGINVTYHDAFLNPPTWKNYDPSNAQATTPAKNVVLDTHQFWGFPPLDKLNENEILQRVCDFGQILKNTTGIPYTIVGEWSVNSGITGNSTSDVAKDTDKRTWFRRLFEAQNAAYSPTAPGQIALGWYYWTWKTEYDIDAWSYRKGLQYGYIPSNISNASTYAIPLQADGCIDINFAYTAPAVPTTTTTNNAGTSGSTSNSGSSSSDKKGAASSIALSPLLEMSSLLTVISFLFVFMA